MFKKNTTKKKSFLRRELDLRPLTPEVNALYIAPWQSLTLNQLPLTFSPWNSAAGHCLKLVELSLWRIERYSYIKSEQGFDSKTRTLTHFFPFEEHTANKAILHVSVLQNHHEVSCWRHRTACNSLHLHEENQLRFINSKHFRFYSTKKHFHFRMIFP